MNQYLESFEDRLHKWSVELEQFFNVPLSPKKIHDSLFIILGDKYKIDYPGDLSHYNIGYEEGLNALKKFDFSVFENTLRVDLDFLRNELFGTKAKIKAAGLVLIIHRYDPDPFPSNPHAHIIDQNIKINLSNGKCYRCRQFIRKLKDKELMEIRRKAKAVKIDLPVLEHK